MENRTILYLFCFLILLTSSCSINKTIILETPFVTVVKLIDAEQALDLEDAKQYIDVIQVYTKLGSENPEEDWKKLIMFKNNLGKDKKFTNTFGYRNYNIEETEKRQNKWVVISIDYSKRKSILQK